VVASAVAAVASEVGEERGAAAAAAAVEVIGRAVGVVCNMWGGGQAGLGPGMRCTEYVSVLI